MKRGWCEHNQATMSLSATFDALVSAGCGDLSLHAHTKRPTFHSHSEGSLVLVPLNLYHTSRDCCQHLLF